MTSSLKATQRTAAQPGMADTTRPEPNGGAVPFAPTPHRIASPVSQPPRPQDMNSPSNHSIPPGLSPITPPASCFPLPHIHRSLLRLFHTNSMVFTLTRAFLDNITAAAAKGDFGPWLDSIDPDVKWRLGGSEERGTGKDGVYVSSGWCGS